MKRTRGGRGERLGERGRPARERKTGGGRGRQGGRRGGRGGLCCCLTITGSLLNP